MSDKYNKRNMISKSHNFLFNIQRQKKQLLHTVHVPQNHWYNFPSSRMNKINLGKLLKAAAISTLQAHKYGWWKKSCTAWDV